MVVLICVGAVFIGWGNTWFSNQVGYVNQKIDDATNYETRNFDTENCTVSVTPATDAGEHSATFSLLQGMWSDGTTANKTIKWVIGRATIAAVPAQSGMPKYDGNPKTPTWDTNYDTTKMTLSVEAQINAGTAYTASFTPTANWQWPDGDTGPKTATWGIANYDEFLKKGMDNEVDRSNEALFQAQQKTDIAVQDMDGMSVDHEYRLTLLELGLSETDI